MQATRTWKEEVSLLNDGLLELTVLIRLGGGRVGEWDVEGWKGGRLKR